MQSLKRVWRKAKEEELNAIKEKISKFEVSLEELLKEFAVFIFEMRRKEVILVKKRQKDLVLKIKPYTAGITFGEFKENEFMLSLAGGSIISSYAKGKRVFLDEEGVLEFIYGKDVPSSYIIRSDPEILDGDLILVLDKKGRYLGLGRAVVRNFRVNKVKNVIDIGWYLRSEIDENKAV